VGTTAGDGESQWPAMRDGGFVSIGWSKHVPDLSEPKDSVLIHHLALEANLDSVMVERLLAKQSVLDAVLEPLK
jgi:hypothetical protein